ncbi:tetratricopeptide repeat protein [Herbaspirillum sp. GCM10030257]|uniref:tetratricopeptide repeat protein n=1 Tax=Herbaspirillum sp. GCM10030257 TaxID=3273393 RepID=UPI00360F177D
MASIKLSRNDPCSCGSGKKYKNCCLSDSLRSSGGTGGISPRSAVDKAMSLHRAGQTHEAEEMYKDILAANPNHADALHLLGVIAHQKGDHVYATELIAKAIDLAPSAAMHANLGMVFSARRQRDAAITCFRNALTIDPKHVSALNNLGVALKDQGKQAEAIECFLQVLSLHPAHTEAYCNLGISAYEQGHLSEAVKCYETALSYDPGNAAAHYNLANALRDQGKLEAAIQSYQAALVADPRNAMAYNNLGNLARGQGHVELAIELYSQALAIDPTASRVHYNFGAALYVQGHLLDAVRCYEKALSFNDEDADTHYNLGNALLDLARYDDARQSFQKSVAINPKNTDGYNNLGNLVRDQGEPELAVDLLRKSLTIDPRRNDIHSNLLFTMLSAPSCSADQTFAEHLRFAEQFEAPLKPFWQAHHNAPDPHKRLRIGYVSGDFRNHAVANYFEPTLARHDKSQVEVFCYYNHHQQDDITHRLAALSDHWIVCKEMSDDALAQRIRDDGIDILVDLSGHTAYNRLLTFARKPAPIQLTWIGYPYTTGLAAMDYRLTDAGMDPPGLTECHNTETLLRLPATSQFQPAAMRPPVNALPALSQGTFTFASLNNLGKITEPAIALWSRILSALPHARLVLGNINDEPTRQKMADSFGRHGIHADRLVMHPKMAMPEYLALHHQIDLALDPFPYNGGTTSLHALSMGVPVLTLAGSSPVTRSGASIMGNAGLPEFVTASEEEYLQRAIEIAQDLPRLDQIRQSLPARLMSPGHPGQRFTQDLETAYRQIWTKWCNTPTSIAA